MRKIFLFVVLIFAPLYGLQAEEVMDLNVEITPYSDGSFAVVENITYDFGTLFRHGIFREILKDHPQDATVWYKERSVDLELQGVAMNGSEVLYEIEDTKDHLRLKIGDPNQEITGVHEYTIRYRVYGGLSYYDNITELFWNVTGHNWEAPIRRVTTKVNNDTNLLVARQFCYAGVVGSTDSCESVIASSTHNTFTTRFLGIGSGLTIAQELKHKAVEKVIIEATPLWATLSIFAFGWLVVLGWFVYRYKTAYRPDETVISQYEPFEDFKPMFSGVLIDGYLHDQDISAGLLYLAQQGFIKIKQTSDKVLLFIEVDDYEVTLLRPLEEVETNFLRSVLSLLFDSSAAVGSTVKLSKLKADTSKRKENQKVVQGLRNDIVKDLNERGYFEQAVTLSTAIVLVVFALFSVPFLLPLLTTWIGSATLPLMIVLVGSVVILGFGYQRRTRKGYAALNHLKGFKEFLSVTETDRLKFHNAPDKNPEQFMELLPYAVAFGVEKEWSEVFKDIDMVEPSWYEGKSSFAPVAFAGDLGAFSNSFSQSSSSSSGSGSSGGGFSGGGAGGGGGGSW